MIEDLHEKYGQRLNQDERAFLERLIKEMAERTYRKFAKGAPEHGHQFLGMSPKDLLCEMRDETTDLNTYEFRLRELEEVVPDPILVNVTDIVNPPRPFPMYLHCLRHGRVEADENIQCPHCAKSTT